jgi:hypothetical protein
MASSGMFQSYTKSLVALATSRKRSSARASSARVFLRAVTSTIDPMARMALPALSWMM